MECNGSLSDEVLANGVMIPHKETHKGQLRHVNREDQSLLPHRIEPWKSQKRGHGPGEGGCGGGAKEEMEARGVGHKERCEK